jgi:hypothetical protein
LHIVNDVLVRTRTHVFGVVVVVAGGTVVVGFGASVVIGIGVVVVVDVVLVVVLVDVEVVVTIEVVTGLGTVVGGIVVDAAVVGDVVDVAHILRATSSSHFSTSMRPSTPAGEIGSSTKFGMTTALNEYGHSGVESPTGISNRAYTPLRRKIPPMNLSTLATDAHFAMLSVSCPGAIALMAFGALRTETWRPSANFNRQKPSIKGLHGVMTFASTRIVQLPRVSEDLDGVDVGDSDIESITPPRRDRKRSIAFVSSVPGFSPCAWTPPLAIASSAVAIASNAC